MTGIVNKPLLLHLVGCLYYLYFYSVEIENNTVVQFRMNADNKAPDTYLTDDLGKKKKNEPDSIKCYILPRDGFSKPSPKQM